QVIATLLGNWRCDEGYGTLAFDYTSIFNAALGGGKAEDSPEWIVSTILKPPDFIGLPAPVVSAVHELESPIVAQDYGDLIRSAAPELAPFDKARPSVTKASTAAAPESQRHAKKKTHDRRRVSHRKGRTQ